MMSCLRISTYFDLRHYDMPGLPRSGILEWYLKPDSAYCPVFSKKAAAASAAAFDLKIRYYIFSNSASMRSCRSCLISGLMGWAISL